MVIKQFKTDRWLWFWISLALYLCPWFLPISPEDGMIPVVFCITSFRDSVTQFTDSLVITLDYIFMFGIPAIGIGWIIHCMIVMVRCCAGNPARCVSETDVRVEIVKEVKEKRI